MVKNKQAALPTNGLVSSAEGLTCIHPRIQCAATTVGGTSTPELDNIAVQRLIDVLAEIIVSVARRNSQD